MTPEPRPAVSLPRSDHRLLATVANEAAADCHPIAGFLLGELNRADILPDGALAPDTVTLNRWVIYRQDRGWASERRQLVCPQDYTSARLHLSVLSALGAALIGLRTGDSIRYRSIEGVEHVATVESLGAPADPSPIAA